MTLALQVRRMSILINCNLVQADHLHIGVDLPGQHAAIFHVLAGGRWRMRRSSGQQPSTGGWLLNAWHWRHGGRWRATSRCAWVPEPQAPGLLSHKRVVTGFCCPKTQLRRPISCMRQRLGHGVASFHPTTTLHSDTQFVCSQHKLKPGDPQAC